MKIIEPSFEILNPLPFNREKGLEILKLVEYAGRTCYKSHDKITEDSALKFVAGVSKRGHHSVIEHYNITAKIITDRGVTHELVRHRIASYSQESTRYCNYGKSEEITVIRPQGLTSPELFNDWQTAILSAERQYMEMLKHGATPEVARSVLPNSLKTEIIMTANLREWLHVFKLRLSKQAHPDIRHILMMLYEQFSVVLPEIYNKESVNLNV